MSPTDVARELRPEVQLLLWGTRGDVDASSAERARTLLRGGLDWERVLRWGDFHGALPSLYTHLSAIESADVPAPVLARLRDRYYEVARRNLYLTAELFGLLDAFESRGIPVIPLKGAVLSNSIYRNPAHRVFNDLDILVRPQDVWAATAVLTSRAFAPWQPLTGAQELAYHRTHYARTYERSEGRVEVDLHWDFAPQTLAASIDPETLWASARATALNDRVVHGFPPELLLLLLCVHGAKHRPLPWPKLKWVLDVARLLEANPRLDWERVLESARNLGVRRILFLGLALAHDLLDTPIPERVRRGIEADAVARGLAARVRRGIFDSAEIPAGFLERLEIELRLRERVSDKMRLALRRITSPTRRDWQLVQLPGPLAWLYLPLRFARLAGAYALRPWKLTRLRR